MTGKTISVWLVDLVISWSESFKKMISHEKLYVSRNWKRFKLTNQANMTMTVTMTVPWIIVKICCMKTTFISQR